MNAYLRVYRFARLVGHDAYTAAVFAIRITFSAQRIQKD
jgi:hypothetical protein